MRLVYVDACYGCGKEYKAEEIAGEYTPHVVCPHCKRERVTGSIRSHEVHLGNRHFYGEKARSLVQGCHPSEVAFLKKIVGPSLEGCVLATGDVRFKNRQQERAFADAMESAKTRNSVQTGCFLNERGQAKLAARKAAGPAGRLRWGPQVPAR